MPRVITTAGGVEVKDVRPPKAEDGRRCTRNRRGVTGGAGFLIFANKLRESFFETPALARYVSSEYRRMGARAVAGGRKSSRGSYQP